MATPRKRKRTITLNVDLLADLGDFGSALRPTSSHHQIAKNFASPLLLGPPKTEALLELVVHMFTDDEAELVAHLKPLRPRSAKKVGKKTGRSADEVKSILDRLATKKKVVLAAGDPKKYTILPLVPGTFEMAIITPDLSTLNSWHKHFAELFEPLYESGYWRDYINIRRAPVRYLPVGPLTKTLYQAWPSDVLEEILEPYDLFGVGQCQCRAVMQLVGKGCGKPLENCVAIGPMATPLLSRGMMRKADRQEIIEIKHKAEEKGCVTWMMNEQGSLKGNISCSCCGCCCHGLRTIRDFSAPGMISKPHFMPVKTDDKCTACKVCVNRCPTKAWSMADDNLMFDTIRCIGCGLCVSSCKFDALELKPVDDAKKPEANYRALMLKMTPSYLKNGISVWARRLFS